MGIVTREAVQLLKLLSGDIRSLRRFSGCLNPVGRLRPKFVYRNWGWSEEEFLSAFRKFALCMAASEDKINRTMRFFVDGMGWKPSPIAEHPILLTKSFEKRIVPRASVLQFLLSKSYCPHVLEIIHREACELKLVHTPALEDLNKLAQPQQH
ncbi:hypothetical protein CRG98_014550 [Punica granatum]|uniref:Uncharacterized protein n=1 Tax=Punica granatum TaxID=22663 RepID=A0A2I0K961_PUNGR|nr:hypothetical protein CRG98_014550 [Punica granatum]